MSDVASDPRLRLLERINIPESRVDFSAGHIVLLCGGPVEIKERASDPDPCIKSLRHAITVAPPKFETFRPEDITDWHVDGMFKNLMSFEQELAAICSLVVIILESAGSIAELGAFSQLNELSSKLIAIKSHDFETGTNVNSFINLGILRFLREGKQSSVRHYPWNVNAPAAIDSTVVSDVLSDLEEDLQFLPRTALFDSRLSSHLASAICEIVSTFAAVKESELPTYLEFFGAAPLAKDALRRKLFLLERFQIIGRETYSDATFYVKGKYPFHRLRLASKDGTRIDLLRANAECLDFYRTDHKQRNRHRALVKSRGTQP